VRPEQTSCGFRSATVRGLFLHRMSIRIGPAI
jgi:hypothetical protein